MPGKTWLPVSRDCGSGISSLLWSNGNITLMFDPGTPGTTFAGMQFWGADIAGNFKPAAAVYLAAAGGIRFSSRMSE